MASDTNDPGILIDAIETVIRTAMAPVVTRLRVLEALAADIPALRERMATMEARPVIPGPAGPAGSDGLGFDDYGIDYDGDRTLTHRWARGGEQKSTVVRVPVPIYRGVHVPGTVYERGDCVTYGGSLWICGAETNVKPGDGSPQWTLAVKRGRDGSRP